MSWSCWIASRSSTWWAGVEHLRSVLNHVPAQVSNQASIAAMEIQSAWAPVPAPLLAIVGQYAGVYDGEGGAAGFEGLRLAMPDHRPDFARRWMVSVVATRSSAKSPTRCHCSRPAKPGTDPARTLMVGDPATMRRPRGRPGARWCWSPMATTTASPVRAVDADGFVDSLAQLA